MKVFRCFHGHCVLDETHEFTTGTDVAVKYVRTRPDGQWEVWQYGVTARDSLTPTDVEITELL